MSFASGQTIWREISLKTNNAYVARISTRTIYHAVPNIIPLSNMMMHNLVLAFVAWVRQGRYDTICIPTLVAIMKKPNMHDTLLVYVVW